MLLRLIVNKNNILLRKGIEMYQNCCKKCGSLELFTEEKGTNTGLYCSDCGAYQKWLNKDELRAFKYTETKREDVTINKDVTYAKLEWEYTKLADDFNFIRSLLKIYLPKDFELRDELQQVLEREV